MAILSGLPSSSVSSCHVLDISSILAGVSGTALVQMVEPVHLTVASTFVSVFIDDCWFANEAEPDAENMPPAKSTDAEILVTASVEEVVEKRV